MRRRWGPPRNDMATGLAVSIALASTLASGTDRLDPDGVIAEAMKSRRPFGNYLWTKSIRRNKSDISESNVGGRKAGTITAARF